ncbi:MAG: DMT family transporter [Pseudomonadota bacterium]
MISHIRTDRRANLIGSLWMMLSMAGFAVEDAFIKAASETVPLGQILILFGLGGMLVFATLAKARGERVFSPAVACPAMAVRAVFEVTGRLFYGLAVVLTPLSSATVILQATPVAVVAGAALVFGERVGWRRWVAIVTGMVGVVITVQPGMSGFSALSIFALIGMLGFAGRDLASRAAPAALGTHVLGVYGFAALVVAGALYAAWEGAAFVVPDPGSALFVLGATASGVLAYASLMKAMRMGDVSAVTPFRYTRLLFGVALGVAVFQERLSPEMLIGSALIVASGLFILWRGGSGQNRA